VDAINVKIRDGQVANRPIYVLMAVTVEVHRDILGIWAGDGGEGAKYWLHVFTELKNRGIDDASVDLTTAYSNTNDQVIALRSKLDALPANARSSDVPR
jgi:transposase-like protein